MVLQFKGVCSEEHYLHLLFNKQQELISLLLHLSKHVFLNEPEMKEQFTVDLESEQEESSSLAHLELQESSHYNKEFDSYEQNVFEFVDNIFSFGSELGKVVVIFGKDTCFVQIFGLNSSSREQVMDVVRKHCGL